MAHRRAWCFEIGSGSLWAITAAFGHLCHFLSFRFAGQQDLVFEHGFIGKLSRSIWNSKFRSLPAVLQQDVAFPIITLGNNGTGTSMHQHEGTWLLLMTGRKAWWIADGSARTGSFAQRDPCQNLEVDLGDLPFQFCIQKPGELVFRA